VKAFCLLSMTMPWSLRTGSLCLGLLTGITVSKQALSQHITSHCVAFFQNVLALVIATQLRLNDSRNKGIFHGFQRVLIQDSTKIRLDDALAEVFPGPRNQKRKATAGMSIQATYELLSETFVHFVVTPFTVNDQAMSGQILQIARKGDLVIRDLGYFATKTLAQLSSSHAFFASRYRHGTAVFTLNREKLLLLEHLRRYPVFDGEVLLGTQERLKVRLVAIPVDPATANERRRKLRNHRDRRRNPNKEHLELLGWQIFVTNVAETTWDTQTVAHVYGLRWRIEILFKAWKKHFKLFATAKCCKEVVETLIYARLIAITLFQVAFWKPGSKVVFGVTQQPASLLKMAEFWTYFVLPWLCMLSSQVDLKALLRQAARHCLYERHRDRLNFAQITRALGLS
jgi:hypothetical protein